MQRAERAERAPWLQSTTWRCRRASRFDLYSLKDLYSINFTAPLIVSSWHLHLKKQAPETSLCRSTDNLKRGYTESNNSFSGNSFRCYPVHVCFSQTSIKDKRHKFRKSVPKTSTLIRTIQDIEEVKLKHSAMILSPDRRKWARTEILCLMKTGPLCLG